MFYISISNGLLKDGHRKRMGSSVWEFMWCIDKVTKIDDKGIGWVLGGKPIRLKEIAEQMDVDEDTVGVNLDKLEEQNYITKLRTPYGIQIKVMKIKKRFNKAEKPKFIGSDENDPSRKNPVSPRKNTVSNKIESVDKTEYTAGASPAVNVKQKNSDQFFKKDTADVGFPMTLSEFVLMCSGSAYRHVRLIGEYAESREFKYETRGQWREFGLRNMRTARRLAPFTDRQIDKAIENIGRDQQEKRGFLKNWGLETIEKYLETI